MSEQNPVAPVAPPTPLEADLKARADNAEQTPAPVKKDFLGPKFAALTRKEKEVREKEKAFETRMKEISEKEAKYSAWEQEQADPSKDWKTKLKSSPLSALQEAGLTIEDIMEAYTLENNPTPEMLLKRSEKQLESKVMSEVEALRKQLADKEAQEQEKRVQQEQEQYQTVVNQFKTEIKSHVESNADTYELITAHGAQDLVFQVIENYHQDTNRILTVEEAAKAVEAHLEEEARKVFELKKFKTPSAPQAKDPKAAPTLSNTLSAQVPPSADKKLSREESLARAAKMLKFTT